MTPRAERMLRLALDPTRRPGAGHCEALAQLYDRLGDEAVNELVDWFNSVDLDSRTELRTLNDLNYARFDAKVDALRAELRAEIKSAAATTETRLIRWMFAFWTTTIVTQVGLFYVLRAK